MDKKQNKSDDEEIKAIKKYFRDRGVDLEAGLLKATEILEKHKRLLAERIKQEEEEKKSKETKETKETNRKAKIKKAKIKKAKDKESR